MKKVIVTSVRTTPPGTNHYGQIGCGFGNHTDKSKVLASFDLWLLKLTEDKATYSSKKEFMNEVMIPAFSKSGSKNPEGMAKTIYPRILKEGKIIEV